MRNGHFQFAVTRSTQRHKISKDVCRILVDVVSSRVNMMNVQSPSARAAFRPATSARLIASVNHPANTLPVSTMLKARPASPMGAVLARHVLNGTFSGTILSALLCFRWECVKCLSAIGASNFGVRSDSTCVGTLSRAVLCLGCFLVKAFFAVAAFNIGHLASLPRRMTIARAERIDHTSTGAPRLSQEFIAAVVARKSHALNQCVCGTLAATMVYLAIVRLEF